MAGTAQGEYAELDAIRSPTQSRDLHRAVRRHPGRSAVVRRRSKPDRPARPGEVEHAITEFAHSPNGGLIVTGGGSGARRELIITLAARLRLPAVYPFPFHVTSGGLTSYGPDIIDQYRRAAGYVDRILKGERPADLPVQAPTKYKLVINLKTAKALGLDVPADATRPRRRGDRMKRREFIACSAARQRRGRWRRARSSQRCR